MKKSTSNKISVLGMSTLGLLLFFTSLHSLANINRGTDIYIQKGYPYEGLVHRSEEVRIFYTNMENQVSCRVEILQKGKVWKGEAQQASLKKFKEKPLRTCLDRDEAKQFLANTF